ncbi:tetratricopeptide repeat protein [Sporobolomyces salmoneus]|uniref:tetratricopeptide repeat protein n=1 Tax=Sporobolomyces salmoneus TaxID=183962 RepID=UPI003177FE79
MPNTPPPPTSSASSLTGSFLEALSNSPPSPRQDPSFFSPTTTNGTHETRKTTETDGTGATGSTEVKGQATRSLIESVAGREERSQQQESEHEEKQSSKSSGGQGNSWIEVEEGGEKSVKIEEEEEDEDDSLRFPEAFRLPSSALVIKQEEEEDEEHDGLSLLRHEESQLFDYEAHRRVSNSQEAEGLERSVTRSQSDFTRWLEDTMRLARGDGSSVIETDDALSSILQATRQTRFGHCSTEDDRYSSYSSVLGTPIQLEASLPFEGELSFELDGDKSQESIKVESIEKVLEDDQVKENSSISSDENEEENRSIDAEETDRRSGNYGWKLLSLSLFLALAYSVHRQRTLAQSLRQPTPSTRFVPVIADNSTTVFSPFATPLPVADTFTLPLYAIAFTLLTAVPTSIHLLRRGGGSSNPSTAHIRATSPLLELNGDAVLSARERLSIGVSHFIARRIQLAISTFTPILDLACSPVDKSVASEWLGRCYYLLARQSGNDLELLEQAQKSLERSIRLDSTRAEPRGGLGKTKYRLRDYRGAVKAFETAISRDEKLWWAYEWLAKSLYRLESGGGGSSSLVEKHLERAISLNPEGSYSAQAFLGEILHLQGQTQRALESLTRSISLRIDQPQVHARLSFIANERLDPSSAAHHFRMVLSTRRYGGRIDETCSVSLEAVRGINPHLSLYFVVSPREKEERLQVLQSALSEYPHDDLLQLLYAIALVKSKSESEEGGDKSLLETRSNQLEKRSERFPEDSFVKGLYALSLLALGHSERAEETYSAFWNQVGGSNALSSPAKTRNSEEKTLVVEEEEEEIAKREEKRRIAFLVMAFFEIKHESTSSTPTPTARPRKTIRAATSPSPVKGKKKTVVKKVEKEVQAETVVEPVVRRSTRLSSTGPRAA